MKKIKVDATTNNKTDDTEYIRRLVHRIDLPVPALAQVLGMPERALYAVLSGDTARYTLRYGEQVALELLVQEAKNS